MVEERRCIFKLTTTVHAFIVFFFGYHLHVTLQSLSSPGSERTSFYRLIGVFRLCAGNDRLDVLFVGRVHVVLCQIFRHGPRFHTLDDHRRTVLARTPTRGHVYCRIGQLDGQFPSRNRLSNHEGLYNLSKLSNVTS